MTEYQQKFQELARDHDGFTIKEYAEACDELDEVYQKALAFDEISKSLKDNEGYDLMGNFYFTYEKFAGEAVSVIERYKRGREDA